MPVAITLFKPTLWAVCFIAAPLLVGLSTFFWKNGEYGVTGGVVLALAMVFWIPAFVALFALISEQMPVYSFIGFLLAVYGCVSGVAFAVVGIFSEAFGISHDAFLKSAQEHSLAFNLLLFWPGPLFPLSLLVLTIVLTLKRVTPVCVGVLMCAGAIAFPVSRIPRIELIAHISDLLLIIPLAYIGVRYFLMRVE